MTARATVPDPTWRPTWARGRGPHYCFFFFESFRMIQIQLLFQTHFKYSMKIYIRKYHFNIKGADHLITKLFFILYDISCPLGPFPPLYNAALLAIFNNQIFTKQNQTSIFIIVFVKNESNNLMYACDGGLLILRVTLMMTPIPCGLRPRTCSLGTYAMIKTTC